MKKFSNFLMNNRLPVIIVLVLTAIAGGVSYFSLPVDAFPDVSPVLVQVFTVTDGLAPEEVEKQVTWPVESAMNGLPGVREVRSVSNFGLSVVNIYFDEGSDIYFARQLVNERLEEARDSIPEGYGEPEMGPIATGQGQILYYYLLDETDSYSLTELRDIQDWIIKIQLQTVKGVTEVLGIGGWEKQYQVLVNPFSLQKYNLTVTDIVEAVEENNLNVGAQYLEQGGEQLLIRSEGLIESISDLKNVIVKSDEGRLVTLQDVADIKIGGAVRRGLQTRNGEGEVVAGMVVKLLGTNSSSVITAVEQRLEEIEKSLPQGIKIIPFYEQKSLVQSSVKTVTSALLQGVILVLLVLFFFLRSVRPSLVAALSIPFSILAAFGAMKLLGISANLMSFGGLAIAIGMIVDGSIVLAENIDKKISLIRNGPGDLLLPDIKDVVSSSYQEVARSIFFSALIVIVVFLPLFTLDGVEGKTFRPLAYTVAIGMGGALIYALVAAPVLASFLMRVKSKTRKSKSGGESGVKKSEMKMKSAKFRMRMISSYQTVLRGFIRKKWLIILSFVLLAVGALAVYPFLGSEFTPRLNEGDIMVNLTFSPSASITETKRNVLILERKMLEIHEVREVVSRIGRGEVGAHSAPVNVVHTNVLLKDESLWQNGASQETIENELRGILTQYPGVLANITQPIQLSVDELIGGVKAELAIKLFGEDLDLLKSTGEAIAGQLRLVEGAADVQLEQMTGSPQLVVRPNRARAARYGITIADIQKTVQASIGGVAVGEVFEGLRRYDLIVRSIEESRNSIDKIKQLMVTGSNGVQVRLKELAEIEVITGPRQILRENGSRFISIQCNVVGRDIGSFVSDAEALIHAEVTLPSGYYTQWGGQFELQQKANQRLMVVMPITLLLVALLLFLNFGSVRESLLILVNIPPALAGGVIALKLFGEHLSVPASVGFIALFGIALGNGLVLISAVRDRRKSADSALDAVLQASSDRIRPVLMTAMTTALGLFPLLLSTGTGSEVQKPLAVVVVGGLLTSTLVTLFLLPGLYLFFHRSESLKG